MATIVKVRRDGIVLHRHPTSNSSNPEGRWHGPWETHSRIWGQVMVDPEAHAREAAQSREVLAQLTREQKAQYLAALKFSASDGAAGRNPMADPEYLARVAQARAERDGNASLAEDLLKVAGF